MAYTLPSEQFYWYSSTHLQKSQKGFKSRRTELGRMSPYLCIPACLHVSMSPCLFTSIPPCLHTSIPPCLHASISLCLHASMPLCLYTAMSPCLYTSIPLFLYRAYWLDQLSGEYNLNRFFVNSRFVRYMLYGSTLIQRLGRSHRTVR